MQMKKKKLIRIGYVDEDKLLLRRWEWKSETESILSHCHPYLKVCYDIKVCYGSEII